MPHCMFFAIIFETSPPTYLLMNETFYFKFNTFSADSEQNAKKDEHWVEEELEISKALMVFCISFLRKLLIEWEDTLIFCSSEKD